MPAALCLIFSSDRSKILLVKRRDLPVWVIPGGGIEKGEQPQLAAEREAFEETGCRIEIARQVGNYSPVNFLSQRTHLFEGKIMGGTLQATQESRDVAFFSVDKLPSLMPPPHRLWIVDGLKNLPHLIVKSVEGASGLDFLKALVQHPLIVFRFLLTKLGIRFNAKSP